MKRSGCSLMCAICAVAGTVLVADCCLGGIETHAFYEIVVESSSCSFDPTYVGADAFTSGSLMCPCDGPMFCSDHDSDAELGSGCVAAAAACGVFFDHCRNGTEAFAEAAACASACRISLSGRTVTGAQINDIDPEYDNCWEGAMATSAAVAANRIVLGSGSGGATVAASFESYTIDWNTAEVKFATVGEGRSLLGLVVLANGNVLARATGIATDNGTGFVDLAEQPDGTLSFVAEVDLPVGTPEISVLHFSGSDSAFDVDGDGRFDAADVAHLATHIGQPTTGLLARFDFIRDGVIDVDDVGLLEAIRSSGVGGGVLGDLDADGDVDCNDGVLVGDDPGSVVVTIGDPAYHIDRDVDVDGDYDRDDWLALQNLLAANSDADFNGDGVTSVSDLLGFLGAFRVADLQADWDGDSDVDVNDLLAFLGDFRGC